MCANHSDMSSEQALSNTFSSIMELITFWWTLNLPPVEVLHRGQQFHNERYGNSFGLFKCKQAYFHESGCMMGQSTDSIGISKNSESIQSVCQHIGSQRNYESNIRSPEHDRGHPGHVKESLHWKPSIATRWILLNFMGSTRRVYHAEITIHSMLYSCFNSYVNYNWWKRVCCVLFLFSWNPSAVNNLSFNDTKTSNFTENKCVSQPLSTFIHIDNMATPGHAAFTAWFNQEWTFNTSMNHLEHRKGMKRYWTFIYFHCQPNRC